ncbi:MAG: aminotransferase class I/II-fold pyridoxal phosphate-dependent enzyme [Bacteroidales bacterium]|nr:aminotransferase class I/II-fold pyridoxal phosphate-dependent enzyme [Candidatus Cacconaster equi]
MQAIILAAGMGRRLGEYTRNNTKCMVPVNGVPMIDRLLRQLGELNLKRVVIVVGYQAENLTEHIKSLDLGGLKVEYVENPVYERTNNIYSLALAKKQLTEDDTLLIESDLMLDDSILPMIVGNPYPNIALVAKYQTWMDGTMVQIDDDSNIVNFIPKKAFKYSQTDSYYKTVNVYKFSREFSTHKYVPFLDAYCKALGNNEYYEQVLRVICMLNTSDLKALPVDGAKWYESDDKADIDVASSIFAQGRERLEKYQKRYGGYWRFPKMLDFCYLVNPYFPSSRMKDELRSNFDTLLTQYPSGMKMNCLLASKCFGVREEYILPGNGAAELIKSLIDRLTGKLGVVFPTFEEYPNRMDSSRVVEFVPADSDFRYNAEEIISYFGSHKVENLLLVNPDNPSGNLLPTEDVESVAEWCKSNGIRLILDESFLDFAQDGLTQSMLKNESLERYPGMVVIKSISKSYGVPGLRLGLLASADRNLIASLKTDVPIWNINSFAEFFMQIFNKYEVDYRYAREKFLQERTIFFEDLSTVPFLRVIPSQANYFLCRTLGISSSELTERLLNEHDILIKDCSGKKGFGGKDFIRIAVRDRGANARLINVLKEYEITGIQ